LSVSVLSRLQRGLEALYRVETQLDVTAFVVNEELRRASILRAEQQQGQAQRQPREQLLLTEQGGELSLGLFLDGAALANLEVNDPVRGLSDANFQDFCLAVEGVSHFIYVALRAARDRPVTALELELQAEVDKFVTCLLLQERGTRDTGALRRRLYDDVTLADDLHETERARYVTANDEARRYAGSLDRRYVRGGRVPDMLEELRRFYRLGLGEKLDHICQNAA
jgi:hypothetical protein